MIRIERDENRCYVAQEGLVSLDNLFVELYGDPLLELVREEGLAVVFDLQGIEYLDRSVLLLLAGLTREASRSGSRFMLCNVSAYARDLIIFHEMEGDLRFCNCQNWDEPVLLELG